MFFFLNNDEILVYNTFFEKPVKLLKHVLSDFDLKLNLFCSDSEKFVHILNLFFKNYVVLCLENILV